MNHNSLGALVGIGMLTAVAGAGHAQAWTNCQLNIGQELNARNFSGQLTVRMQAVCDNITRLVVAQFSGQEAEAATLATQAVRDMLDGLQNNCPKGSIISEWDRRPSTVSVSADAATVYVNSGLQCARPNGTKFQVEKMNAYVFRDEK